ncbi:hypothetical protein [Streptomyces sp. TP-A0875]|uniref:hypothetical protein n=1 Tax=Streptomyces sp. TP-A0875 TaxID=552354 RepID=UPI0006B40A48|nr:hypothetical protein [Streptomyces sp. TP-A0875]
MPKLAAILATLAGLLAQLVGVTILITARAAGDAGTISSTGLALATAGLLFTLGGIPPACRSLYTWSRDRAYVLYHEHQRQDTEADRASIVHLTSTRAR